MKHWYMADGGSGVPDCTPSAETKECDKKTWSLNTLTDVGHFPETGKPQPDLTLKTLPDLVGATVTINDGESGFWTANFPVKTHNKAAGKITIDGEFYALSRDHKGIRAYSHYFVQNKLSLLDSPGEYWFDEATSTLYVWKNDDAQWSDIEISTDAEDQEVALAITGKSHWELSGITFSFFHTILQESYRPDTPSEFVKINNCHFHTAAYGLRLLRAGDLTKPLKQTRFWTVTNNEWSHIDEVAVFSKPQAEMGGTGRDPKTEISTLQTITSTTSGLLRATNITFIYNTIEGGNATRIVTAYALKLKSDAVEYPNILPSAKGDNLVARNNFSRACEMKADCAAVDMWGKAPFNTLFFENVGSNSFGYTGAGDRGTNGAGAGSGMTQQSFPGGVFLRNVIFNIDSKGFNWYCNEDTKSELWFLNNLIARVAKCVRSRERHLKQPLSITIQNNIFVDCDIGINLAAPSGGTFPREYYDVDYNLYMLMDPDAQIVRVGHKPGTETFKSLAALGEAESGRWIEGWETHGSDTVEVGAGYKAAKLPPRTSSINDHRIRTYDPAWFAPTSAQLDASNPSFPDEVERLLRHFDICIPIAQEHSNLPIGPHPDGAKCFKGIGSLDGGLSVPTSLPAAGGGDTPPVGPYDGDPTNGDGDDTVDQLDSAARRRVVDAVVPLLLALGLFLS
ncbi:unnamed protein product [Vitrella brassicaformis CCMP3155]|uniref:Right handed beta helix domain-containing protein n=1 Tax=Vitrella brassicaformis (strain CCMP3155) TaxID=1169540 RepID=A0A0G4GVC7_VITBC|nr:unnamed protein product [Vitrella brassicaformis CCMP3155]|eukprot:CEM34699.1 unnamed protein product [Vitrella brassicaformis CCMP3155]